MTHFFLAETSGGIGSLFTALGIDWRSLLLNAAAFLVIVWAMAKWVYPALVKALDAKRDELAAAARSQEDSAKALEAAQAQATKIVGEARDAAREVARTAKAEAAELAKQSEERAAAQAERMVTEAREQLARDVEAARKSLKTETAALVAQATEHVIGQKLDAAGDAKLVARSLEEGRQ